MSDKPTILCVDDEINVLEGLKISLRKTGRILTAESGSQGLEMLSDHPDVAVVVSDMRMPQMDGATFLARAHEMRPETVRILLTGFSDMEAAVRAVNEGQLFRFLTKPCPPDMLVTTIQAALDQHRLITAEKVLLQRTLLGSVQALMEVLALDNPQAMGRAMRIRRRVREMAGRLELRAVWPAEFAAIFSQLGLVSLPQPLQQKVYQGHALDEEDALAMSRNVDVMVSIIGKIPRLEPAIEILKKLVLKPTTDDLLDVRIIRAAILIEAAESRGQTKKETMADITGRGSFIGDDVIAAAGIDTEEVDGVADKRSVRIRDLTAGMVILNDLYAVNEILLAPRGLTLNAASVEHIVNFGDKINVESVEVLGGESA